MQGSKKLGSLPNKIYEQIVPKDRDLRESIGFSLAFHVVIAIFLLLSSTLNIKIFEKPKRTADVVWAQTVKRKKPTIPDKLPAPLVPKEKPKKEKTKKINTKKETKKVTEKKKVEETREEKMKKALAKLQQNLPEDDRPTPKENNFPTASENPTEGVLSSTEILALESSTIYSAYIQQLRQIVENNRIWFGKNQNAEVSMKIDPQGQLSRIKVAKSSGDFAFDQATLRAIHKSNPVPPPPTELVQLFLQEAVIVRFGMVK